MTYSPPIDVFTILAGAVDRLIDPEHRFVLGADDFSGDTIPDQRVLHLTGMKWAGNLVTLDPAGPPFPACRFEIVKDGTPYVWLQQRANGDGIGPNDFWGRGQDITHLELSFGGAEVMSARVYWTGPTAGDARNMYYELQGYFE